MTLWKCTENGHVKTRDTQAMWDMARAQEHECLLPMVFVVAEGAGVGVVIKRSLSRPLVPARSVGEIAITKVVLTASKSAMEGREGPGARGTGRERERANSKKSKARASLQPKTC
jgi:hypothetical protein